MAIYRLDQDNIRTYANRFVSLMRENEAPVPKNMVCDQLGLTVGQVSTLVKYMRRCAEKDLERYIPYYPISSKHGYTLPKTYDDFLPCFATLYKWCTSLSRTIEPMKRKMLREGIDIDQYISNVELSPEDSDSSYLDNLDEMNKDTSWFLNE